MGPVPCPDGFALVRNSCASCVSITRISASCTHTHTTQPNTTTTKTPMIAFITPSYVGQQELDQLTYKRDEKVITSPNARWWPTAVLLQFVPACTQLQLPDPSALPLTSPSATDLVFVAPPARRGEDGEDASEDELLW